MSRRRYQRARTLHERRRRALLGLVAGVFIFGLVLILLGLLSLLDRESDFYKPLLYCILLGVPIGLGIALEWWIGSRNQEG